MSNPKKPTDIGQNKTGIAVSPIDSRKTIEGARESIPAPSFDVTPIEAVRIAVSRTAEPVGTMPPPASLKGVAKAGMQAIKGNNPNVFIDLIADRLAFERTGTRLYEALIAKVVAAGDHPGGPTRAEVEQIRDEELAHAGLLIQAMDALGADATALTPTADVTAVASSGILQVLTDPRTTLTHALHAVHMAELTDNDAWVMLSDLAENLGQDDMAAQFRQALVDEERHLDLVRAWLTSAIEGQAGIKPEVTAPEAGVPAP